MYIAIAGNIGSGKTTLTDLLSTHYKWTPVYEQSDDNPYLVNFYNNMLAWSFHLQIYFLQSRYQHIIQVYRNHQNIIQDRTIYEDAYVFAPNLHDMGLLTTTDLNTYLSMFKLLNSLTPQPDLMIYLKASVPKLIDLIQKRGREYETSIRIDYITSLNQKYDLWYENYIGKKILINVDKLNFINNEADFLSVVEKIDNTIKPLS